MLEAMGLANDIYAQVGIVMLVGLLGKNAVLIVEFAVQKRHEGATIVAAAIEAAKVRFRPILMTSFAFIAGLVPLVFATGPGAIANRTIGGSAMGGMLLGVIFGTILVPGLYVVFATLSDGRRLIKDEEDEPLTEDIVHTAHLAPDDEEIAASDAAAGTEGLRIAHAPDAAEVTATSDEVDHA